MPRSQLEAALVAELGPEWRAAVADFDYEPLAAASIGQVHTAISRVIQCHINVHINGYTMPHGRSYKQSYTVV